MNLATMSNSQFKDVIDKEVRDGLDDVSSKALRTDVPERWYTALVAIKQSVESQLAAKSSDVKQLDPTTPEYTAAYRDYHRWRAGALRFLSGIDTRISEARPLRNALYDNQYSEILKAERNAAYRETLQLREAIRCHRRKVTEEFDPNEFDQALWAEVD